MFNPTLFQGDIMLRDVQMEYIIDDMKKQLDETSATTTMEPETVTTEIPITDEIDLTPTIEMTESIELNYTSAETDQTTYFPETDSTNRNYTDNTTDISNTISIETNYTTEETSRTDQTSDIQNTGSTEINIISGTDQTTDITNTESTNFNYTTEESPQTDETTNNNNTDSIKTSEMTQAPNVTTTKQTTIAILSPNPNEIKLSGNNSRFKRNDNSNNNPFVYNWNLPILYYSEPLINQDNLVKAMKLIHQNTCIRFVRNKKYITTGQGINFYRGYGCWSFIGLVFENQPQEISLDVGCDDNVGIIQHQIGHALGLLHQQMHVNVSLYNDIDSEKIKDGFESNMIVLKNYKTLETSSDYDYGSGMIFDDKNIGVNGSQVIKPKIKYYNGMRSNRKKLNFNDYKIINKYYCNNKCPNKLTTCKNGGYQDPNHCYSCKCPGGYDGKDCDDIPKSIGACGVKSNKAQGILKALVGKGISNCYYHIKSEQFSKIYLYLDASLTNEMPTCTGDSSLEIKYRINKDVTGLCLCGFNRNITIVSDGNFVIIHYNGKSLFHYFRLLYKQIYV
uniref:Metalloendopeptidase n=1 Tax=Parastrongyloides trichosuri TaxID=131310 RepID=A0A0N4ZZF1_PARTI